MVGIRLRSNWENVRLDIEVCTRSLEWSQNRESVGASMDNLRILFALWKAEIGPVDRVGIHQRQSWSTSQERTELKF